MACIITYENKQYTQKEFEQYLKEHFVEFVDTFLGSKADIQGFKDFVDKPIFDKELAQKIQDKLQKKLLLELSATEKITKEVATTKHGTDEYRFSIGEFNKNKNSVRVAKNIEGDFSIHEGNLDELSKSQKVALFKAQSNVIPIGGQIVQRGGSSFDGIRHRINLQNHGFSIQYATDNLQEYKSNDINAVQEFANKYGLGKVIEKDGKLFTKGVILTKENTDAFLTRRDLGSKQDIEGFRKFVDQANSNLEKEEIFDILKPFNNEELLSLYQNKNRSIDFKTFKIEVLKMVDLLVNLQESKKNIIKKINCL